MTHAKKVRLVEFLIIGVVMGTAEDLLAVFIATDAKFSWNILIVVFLVALPFSFISEIVVDHPDFWKKIWPEVHPVKEIESFFNPHESKIKHASGKDHNLPLFNRVKEEAREIKEEARELEKKVEEKLHIKNDQ